MFRGSAWVKTRLSITGRAWILMNGASGTPEESPLRGGSSVGGISPVGVAIIRVPPLGSYPE